MSDLISLLATAGAIARTSGELAQVAGLANLIDNSGESWQGGAWVNRLQPGSWRGVGFVLDTGETIAGRRVAIHEYPYRDTAWTEDLGLLPRRFNVRAFLVGDDVYQQRDAMLAACEMAGSGTLVHPTLGSLEVVLLQFSVTDRRERGRIVDFSLQFILASDVKFPSTSIATADAITAAGSGVNAASQSDLSAGLQSLAIIPAAARDVSGFTGLAIGAVNDATRALHTVQGMVGNNGRYSNGSRLTLLAQTANVQGLLADATSTRGTVMAGASNIQNLAGLL